MEEKVIDLIYGSLLHDIGKVVQRAERKRIPHSEIGAEYLKKFTDNKAIQSSVKYHHYRELSSSPLAVNDLAYITYIADNISSGTDRRSDSADDSESSYFNFNAMINQEDIFNTLYNDDEKYQKNDKRFYKPEMLDDRKEINFTSTDYREFNSGDYQAIVNKISANLEKLDFDKNYINSLLAILESTLTYVPSSTNLDEVIDVSLYDHSKLTAAFASTIYYYLEDKKEINYRKLLFHNSKTFYEEEAFILLNFDISGIQDFIYMIKDSKAAKMLRTRSFYLEILSEHLADELLSRLNLSRANLIYLGGGGGYFLLPNTQKAKSTISEVQAEINQFLRDYFRNDLFIALGYYPFKAADTMDRKGRMSDIYQLVEEQVRQQKSHRYSASEILELNKQGKISGRECSVCYRIYESVNPGEDHSSEPDERCHFCQGLIDFSRPFQETDFFLISTKESPLPIGFNKYLHAGGKKEIKVNEFKGRLYSKNKFYIGDNQTTQIWVADYVDKEGLDFNEYAASSDGIKRIAVVRSDVDNLGRAFIRGFAPKFNTMSRFATFSRMMSLYFNHYINMILDKLNITGSVIYSGGDDVFIVGEWMDMLQFAIEFRQEFIKYSQGKLTLSTGIGLYPAKTPISIMARATGDLEEAAKHHSQDKDALALFSKENVFKWDDFINNVWEDKLVFIQNYFDNFQMDQEYGKSFIYTLIDLIEKSFEEVEDKKTRGSYKTLSWAQWAYYLSRMEPQGQEDKDKFREFSKRLHYYFQDTQQVKELKMALELYIYSIRGE